MKTTIKVFFGIIFAIMLMGTVSALQNSSILIWADFITGGGTNIIDQVGHSNGTINGSVSWNNSGTRPTNIQYALNAQSWSTTNNIFWPSNNYTQPSQTDNYTISIWAYGAATNVGYSGKYGASISTLHIGALSNGTIYGYIIGTGNVSWSNAIAKPVWQMITVTVQSIGGSTKAITIYVNATKYSNFTDTASTIYNNAVRTLGFTYESAAQHATSFGQFIIVNGTIDQGNLTCLYNAGAANNYSNFSNGCLGITFNNTLVINAADYYDNTSIQTFNSTIILNNTQFFFNTSNGTIVTNISWYGLNNISAANITIQAPNYFQNSSLNANISSATYNPFMYQAVAAFNAFEIISGVNNTGFQATVTNQSFSGSPPVLYLKAGNYNVTFNDTNTATVGWYNTTMQINVSALTNYTYNFTNTSQWLLNITARNKFSGLNDNVFTATIRSGLFNYTFWGNTSNGSLIVPWVNDTNFNISIVNASTIGQVSGLFNTSNNTNNTPTLVNITLQAYTTNTFFFNIMDEDTQAIINQVGGNIILTGSVASYNISTSNGTANLSLVVPEEYFITFSETNYTTRGIYFTMVNQSQTGINLYLLKNSQATTFQNTVVSLSGNQPVPNMDVWFMRKNLTGTNYYLVEICRTASTGVCFTSIELYTINNSAIYNVFIQQNGSVFYTLGDSKLGVNSLTYQINTGNTSLRSFFNYENLQYSFTNTSTNFVATYSDAFNQVTAACVEVTKRTGVNSVVTANTCANGGTGNLVVPFTLDNTSNEVIGQFSVVINNQSLPVAQINLVNNANSPAYGEYALLFIVLPVLLTMLFGLGTQNPAIAMATGTFVLFICWTIGLTNFSQTVIGGLLVLAGVFILKMRT